METVKSEIELIEKYISESIKAAKVLIENQRQFSNIVKLTGVKVKHVLASASMDRDYFYRRRDGMLTPAEFYILIKKFEIHWKSSPVK